jgi:hypothetical protein
VLGDPRRHGDFTLARLRGTEPVSFALDGTTCRLLVVHRIHVVDDHCRTLAYQYRFSLTDEKASWLIRWEYLRQQPAPDYEYPLAHVHVNAAFAADETRALPKLHIPTERVALELVLWHLIAEWDVIPRRDDWRDVLGRSLEGFVRRRRSP